MEALERQREWLNVTLSSIGDGVISTDTQGTITFLNPEAARLTGWSVADALGQPLEAVFRIVHDRTRQPVDPPVARVLRDGVVVGLANHTLLLARDSREHIIADSSAPIGLGGGAWHRDDTAGEGRRMPASGG